MIKIKLLLIRYNIKYNIEMKVGYVHDERMLLHSSHKNENPDSITAILDELSLRFSNKISPSVIMYMALYCLNF